MSETSIAVVKGPGSRDLEWHGALQYEASTGYSGKLLSYETSKLEFPQIFDLPPALDRSAVFCILNGAEFATALWPRYGGKSTNFVSRSIEIRIPTLLRNVHADESETCVDRIICQSPIVLSLFGIKAFDSTFSNSPYCISIQTKYGDIGEYRFSNGTIELSSTGTFSPSHRSPNLICTGEITIVLANKISVGEAVRFVGKIENLLSLLCFSHVQFDDVSLRVELDAVKPQPDDTAAERNTLCKLERARRSKDTKTDLEPHQLALRISKDFPLGRTIDEFLKIYSRIERSLSWYRIVAAEERYLEDKFFYSVRMIESLYQTLDFELEKDAEATNLVSQLCTITDGHPQLGPFVRQRVKPIFSHSSGIGSIIKDLRYRYAAIPMMQILDDRRISKLRAKEAHGTSERYSGADYRYMIHSYRLFMALYPCLILERCGIDRDFLFDQLGRSKHEYRRLFEATYVSKIAEDIKPEQEET